MFYLIRTWKMHLYFHWQAKRSDLVLERSWKATLVQKNVGNEGNKYIGQMFFISFSYPSATPTKNIKLLFHSPFPFKVKLIKSIVIFTGIPPPIFYINIQEHSSKVVILFLGSLSLLSILRKNNLFIVMFLCFV